MIAFDENNSSKKTMSFYKPSND